MTAAAAPASTRATLALLPFTAIVFAGYCAVGLPLATLPLHVHEALGFGTTTVGLVIGVAPAATLLTRQVAGRLADRRGPRFGVVLGLLTAAASGLCYLLASFLPTSPALAAILLGRVLLGLGDSLFTTAISSWAITRVGAEHAGRTMAWVGIAMYGALAFGASAGISLADSGGFPAIGVAVAVLPLLGLPIAAALADVPGTARPSLPLATVLRAIWPPGLAMVLACGGFGTIGAFMSLRYAALGWTGAGLAITAFGAVYIVARLFLAGLPDRIGGRRVATVCLVIEAAGLLLIAAAPTPAVALAGAAVTGLGYSLVFPSLGVEAVRRVPPDRRGVALGAFLACFDFGLGVSGPAMGPVAALSGLPGAFVASAVLCLGALLLVRATPAR